MTTNRTHARADSVLVIQGIVKHFQNETVTFSGVKYDAAKLTSAFQSHIDAIDEVRSLHGEWIAAIQRLTAVEKNVTRMRLGLQDTVRQAHDNSAAVLGDFGFSPKKSTAVTDPTTKVVAAAKARATRAARHTMGNAQKRQIFGQIEAPILITHGPGGVKVSLGPPGAIAPPATTLPLVASDAHEAPPSGPEPEPDRRDPPERP